MTVDQIDEQLTTYPISQERDAQLVPALVDELERFGVELPSEISRTAGQLRDLTAVMARALDRAYPTDLVGMDEEILMAVIRQQAAAAAVNRDIRRGLYGDLRSVLAGQLADVLAACADDVVGKLREAGRAPAEAVHRATRLGINPHTTDAAIVRSGRSNLDDLAATWTSLSTHVERLEQLASLRLRLSAATGVPPIRGWDQTGRVGQSAYEAAAKASAFGVGERWQADPQELPWQRWVRLSADGPVMLASIDESHAVMRARGTMVAASTVRHVPVSTPSKRDREIYEVM